MREQYCVIEDRAPVLLCTVLLRWSASVADHQYVSRPLLVQESKKLLAFRTESSRRIHSENVTSLCSDGNHGNHLQIIIKSRQSAT